MKGLYQLILGDDFQRMAPVLRALHDGQGALVQGDLTVKWGRPIWQRLLLRLTKMPRQSLSSKCQVQISPLPQCSERWVRSIGARSLTSLMQPDERSRIIEQVGLITAHLTTSVDTEGRLQQRSDRIYLRWLGWPLPGLVITASEEAIDKQRFRCHVNVSLGRFGTLLSYEGVLCLQQRSEMAIKD